MILIIANARIKGGLSGSDNIYLHLAEAIKDEWQTFLKSSLKKGGGYLLPPDFANNYRVWEMLDTDFRPFVLCYVWKIIKGIWKALWDFTHYEYVYSASDFWMDVIPAFILKLKGNKWVAGCYMKAPKKNWIYYWSQKPMLFLMNNFADCICVTTSDIFGFKKPTVDVHGGVDMKLAYPPGSVEKIYDAVFVGRLHYTKGIKELIEIWDKVIEENPNAQLAVIGSGDTEEKLLSAWAKDNCNNVHWFGYMGEERFDVYRQSKMVLYPTPYKYSHFSMGPIEAMACGCPMVAFNLDVMKIEKTIGQSCYFADDIEHFISNIQFIIECEDWAYKSFSKLAVEYARTWDWSVRAPMILKEIKEKL